MASENTKALTPDVGEGNSMDSADHSLVEQSLVSSSSSGVVEEKNSPDNSDSYSVEPNPDEDLSTGTEIQERDLSDRENQTENNSESNLLDPESGLFIVDGEQALKEDSDTREENSCATEENADGEGIDASGRGITGTILEGKEVNSEPEIISSQSLNDVENEKKNGGNFDSAGEWEFRVMEVPTTSERDDASNSAYSEHSSRKEDLSGPDGLDKASNLGEENENEQEAIESENESDINPDGEKDSNENTGMDCDTDDNNPSQVDNLDNDSASESVKSDTNCDFDNSQEATIAESNPDTMKERDKTVIDCEFESDNDSQDACKFVPKFQDDTEDDSTEMANKLPGTSSTSCTWTAPEKPTDSIGNENSPLSSIREVPVVSMDHCYSAGQKRNRKRRIPSNYPEGNEETEVINPRTKVFVKSSDVGEKPGSVGQVDSFEGKGNVIRARLKTLENGTHTIVYENENEIEQETDDVPSEKKSYPASLTVKSLIRSKLQREPDTEPPATPSEDSGVNSKAPSSSKDAASQSPLRVQGLRGRRRSSVRLKQMTNSFGVTVVDLQTGEVQKRKVPAVLNNSNVTRVALPQMIQNVPGTATPMKPGPTGLQPPTHMVVGDKIIPVVPVGPVISKQAYHASLQAAAQGKINPVIGYPAPVQLPSTSSSTRLQARVVDPSVPPKPLKCSEETYSIELTTVGIVNGVELERKMTVTNVKGLTFKCEKCDEPFKRQIALKGLMKFLQHGCPVTEKIQKKIAAEQRAKKRKEEAEQILEEIVAGTRTIDDIDKPLAKKSKVNDDDDDENEPFDNNDDDSSTQGTIGNDNDDGDVEVNGNKNKISEATETVEKSALKKPKFTAPKRYCIQCYYNLDHKCYFKSRELNKKIENRTCGYCQKVFSDVSRLTIHVRKHTNERPFKCETCGKGFRQIHTLREHCLIHGGEKKFECTDCGKKFLRKSDLTCHMVKHTGQYKYLCNLCGKGFKKSWYLKIHMRKHTGEKAFLCTECGKGFNMLRLLEAHTLQHRIDEEPLRCIDCKKVFGHEDEYRIHECSSKNRICRVCAKTFAQNHPSHMKKHMQVHEKEKDKPCQSCHVVFPNEVELQSHRDANIVWCCDCKEMIHCVRSCMLNNAEGGTLEGKKIRCWKCHQVKAGGGARKAGSGAPATSLLKGGSPATSLLKSGSPATSLLKSGSPATSLLKGGAPASAEKSNGDQNSSALENTVEHL